MLNLLEDDKVVLTNLKWNQFQELWLTSEDLGAWGRDIGLVRKFSMQLLNYEKERHTWHIVETRVGVIFSLVRSLDDLAR